MSEEPFRTNTLSVRIMNANTTKSPCFIGIDVGGTGIKVGVVNDDGESLAYIRVPTETDKGFETGLQNLFRAVEQAVAESPLSMDQISAIGLATPGTLDIPAGMLLKPHNLPGWRDVPIRQIVADRFQKLTFLQNDANAAAYGEYWVGAARDVHSVVFWTLGTGIGAGIIIGDMIVRGEHSHGSECGHIIIEMTNGRPCDSGQSGTLEAYASAKSLVRRCEEALQNGRDSSLREVVDNQETLTPVLIGRAAEHGDELADELLMDTARFMGIGTTNLIHTIDPNMVLIGGAMTFGRNETELGRRFLQRIRDEVHARAFPVPAAKVVIDYATLGGDAGYIGAAGYARRKYNQTATST